MAALALRTGPPETAALRRDRLILEHLPQVRLIARRIQERLPQHIALEDLISTGVIGLISAIDHFDTSHGVKLKTYAEYKIRGAILDSLRGMDWVPRQKRRKARQIELAVASAEQRLQRAPTEEETAAELRVSVQQYRGWLLETRGVNAECRRQGSGDDTRNLLETLPAREENIPSNMVERAALHQLLTEFIDRIPPVERMILRMYYQENMTLKQIAAIAHVHESRISQLKTQAIQRLRTRMQKCWPGPRPV